MKTLLVSTFLLLFCHVMFGQSEPAVSTVGIEEIYLAKDNGDGKAGDQTTEFRTTDVPIYCVVLLDSDEKTTVKMNFVAVSVSGVKADTKVVTASYTTKQGQNRVNFSGRPDGNWTPGKYRVDLFVDGKIVKKLEFNIKAGGAAIDDASAAKYLQEPAVPPSKPSRFKKIKP